jgi:hypothetical protein
VTALTAVPLPAAAVVAGLVTSSAGTQSDKLRQPPLVTSEYNVCEGNNIQREVKELSTVLAGLPPFGRSWKAICTHLVTGPRVLHSGENS